jgi:outer membrane protein assembly factor BamB
MLWQHPYNNYQLVLQGGALYGLSGQIDKDPSRKFDPLTGRVLEEVELGRRACTRPTGALDAIFCRASGGSTRWDLASDEPQLVSPMRAQCQDGVTIANGRLYWWPSTCDCNLTLYGVTCLAPAGDFDFAQPAREAERLERGPAADAPVAELPVTPADWPTFRADNAASVTSQARLPDKVTRLWQFTPKGLTTPTAPTAAGGLVFFSGADGIVHALDADTGAAAWTAYTGGGVRFPPTLAGGRALVGSGDGWVYAFEARTGRLLWRFRAAPQERLIPVYGQLLSTWPAASGVLVHNDTAYVAAGIVNFDGTHVYALDAATGRLRWQNNSSGHLDPTGLAGVSVQGHMILHEGRLCLAGGNAVSPALYDPATGRCLNDTNLVRRRVNNNVPASESPRGSELYRIGSQVMVSGKPFYAHPKYLVYDASVLNKSLLASTGDFDLLWVNNARLLCFERVEQNREQRFLAAWGKPNVPGLKPLWEAECRDSVAFALARNAALVAHDRDVAAFNLADGRKLWSQALPASPVPWGLAVDRQGRAVLTLEDGRVLCFGEGQLTAAR